MKGYKVVNYVKWSALPDIFSNIKEAKKAKNKWKLGEEAVIEYFNSNHKQILNTIVNK